MRRRRYRDDPYYQGRRSSRRGGGGDSCARDACLLETGCCVAEALDGNCLVTGLMLLPRMFTMSMSGRSDRTIDLIRIYQQQISAKRAEPVCRFSPSCSNYAIDAINAHGIVRGMVLAGRRLIRCRPGGMRGADPVPA